MCIRDSFLTRKKLGKGQQQNWNQNFYTITQIAGDRLKTNKEALATGFFAVGPTYKGDGGDPEATNAAKAIPRNAAFSNSRKGKIACRTVGDLALMFFNPSSAK